MKFFDLYFFVGKYFLSDMGLSVCVLVKGNPDKFTRGSEFKPSWDCLGVVNLYGRICLAAALLTPVA